MDCLSESAWVKWEDPVRNLGQNYTVTSTDQLGQVERFECSDTLGLVWCAVPNMTCGRHLNFTLTASDQQCPSGSSNMIMTETGGCFCCDDQNNYSPLKGCYFEKCVNGPNLQTSIVSQHA